MNRGSFLGVFGLLALQSRLDANRVSRQRSKFCGAALTLCAAIEGLLSDGTIQKSLV